MAAISKRRCVKTVFQRTILCAGTMTDYVKILKREMQGTNPNNTQVSTTLTEVAAMMGAVENRNPVQRFDGVVISDTITHAVYIPFDQAVYELDRGTLFIELEKTRNRYLKISSIHDLDEQEKYLVLYCQETGFTDLEAAK